jgi:hypothetical protein
LTDNEEVETSSPKQDVYKAKSLIVFGAEEMTRLNLETNIFEAKRTKEKFDPERETEKEKSICS